MVKDLTPAEVAEHMFSGSRDVPWWYDEPNIGWPGRQLLQEYSGYDHRTMDEEVIALRDRAWEMFPYPCISQFQFLDFSLSQLHRLYPRLLWRLQAGARFLDIGCCLGHDIRKLIFDGVPAAQLKGVELQQGFIDLGFELFRDKDRLPPDTFLQGDILEDGAPWTELAGTGTGGFDVVQLANLLHLLAYEEQITAFKRAIQCLKPGLGTTIFGIAAGTVGGTVEDWAGKKVPAHNVDSFKKLVADLEKRTETKWTVEVSLDFAMYKYGNRRPWGSELVRRVVFELTRVG